MGVLVYFAVLFLVFLIIFAKEEKPFALLYFSVYQCVFGCIMCPFLVVTWSVIMNNVQHRVKQTRLNHTIGIIINDVQ